MVQNAMGFSNEVCISKYKLLVTVMAIKGTKIRKRKFEP